MRADRLRLLAVTVALVAATVGADSAGASGGSLLVVGSLPSGGVVAHRYSREGRLLNTLRFPPLTQVSWSPDGSMIAIGDGSGVSVESADGGGRRQLLKTKTNCRTLCLFAPLIVWSPDGKQLAVGGADPRMTGLVLVDLATGRTRPLRQPKPAVLHLPIAFSPNGRWLAETASSGISGTASCCSMKLVVSRADGTRPRTLHSFADPIHDSAGAATWSPDSTRIAFSSDGRDRRDPRLAIVDVRTGGLQALNPRHVYDQSPAWSPDGTRLALTQFNGPVFIIRSDGTGYRPLALRGVSALWLHNGDLLVAVGTSGRTITRLPGARSPARPLLSLPKGEGLLGLNESR
jgi:Tol biopolymer transport system component